MSFSFIPYGYLFSFKPAFRLLVRLTYLRHSISIIFSTILNCIRRQYKQSMLSYIPRIVFIE